LNENFFCLIGDLSMVVLKSSLQKL